MILDKFFSLFSKVNTEKKESSNKEMTNVVNSMFLCKPIYDKLKVKCHPDRYIDENNRLKAETLFQELQIHKYNYEKLLEIESQVNQFESSIKKDYEH